jgi:hypothetical protein
LCVSIFKNVLLDFRKQNKKELHQLTEETMRKMAAAKLTSWKKNIQE